LVKFRAGLRFHSAGAANPWIALAEKGKALNCFS
jgi:hypothetical protein